MASNATEQEFKITATEHQYAYLAGLIDGDGCVAFRKRRDKKTKSGFTFCPQLIVVSKDLFFLEKLKETFFGHIDTQGKSAFNGKQIWSLRFSTNEMRAMLPELIPHLILKRREAELLLEGITITVRHRFSDYDPTGLDRIVDAINALKKIGREVFV